MGNLYHRYLLRVQYLGFRYSGWQVQPKQRTIAGMLEKTFLFLYPEVKFKFLGAGRTDAKVSALDAACELFSETSLSDLNDFLNLFNENLPADIRITTIEPVGPEFNIIQDGKSKEYLYFFSFGTKSHPFSAPFITNYQSNLNLDDMKLGALLFEGTHDFSVFSASKSTTSKRVRTIEYCRIESNRTLTANFFPENSYILRVRGKGFMRYQIRMIMGALYNWVKMKRRLNGFGNRLKPNSTAQLNTIAPGSGLILNQIEFKDLSL